MKKIPRRVAAAMGGWSTSHKQWFIAVVATIALGGFLLYLAVLQNPSQKRLQFYLSRTMTANIAYCHGQKLDFYAPRRRLDVPSPVVLFVHGGGWLINNKQSDPDQIIRLDPLLDEGYAIASIDYRSLPRYHFPAPVKDGMCAVRFLKANAARFNINGEKMVVFGNSAGASIAAMIGVLGATDNFKTSEYNNYSDRVNGVITLGGQMDFTQQVTLANRARTAWLDHGYKGNVKPYPVANVTNQTPPFLLIHGINDKNVHYQQAELMAKALEAHQVPHQLLLVSHADHALHPFGGRPQPSLEDVNKQIQQFVRQATR